MVKFVNFVIAEQSKTYNLQLLNKNMKIEYHLGVEK